VGTIFHTEGRASSRSQKGRNIGIYREKGNEPCDLSVEEIGGGRV
jgi:hypothetical protein